MFADIRFCPKCDQKMKLLLGIFGFYYHCDHCMYTEF